MIYYELVLYEISFLFFFFMRKLVVAGESFNILPKKNYTIIVN